MNYGPLKRAIDVCASGAALLVLAPVFAGVALAIRASGPGPSLYRSARLGINGTTFQMLKFRTMRVNAPDIRNADGSTYSGAEDPRITPIGHWLRRTSLDELPQLWNVLRGDMSLVGPRPELPDQVSQYSETDRRRLLVRPGITGLAQVSGRNDLAWKDRRALDVQYVNSLSLRHDLLILARTIPGVLSARGVFAKPREENAPPRS
jgi:lipopolysaccharide/colanic/teichoic acid biosynthesis glycosyltransferase